MTANEVYLNALALNDELDSDGTASSSTDELYKEKSVRLLNMLMREVARYESAVFAAIVGMDEDICVSDDAGERILPYGLAAKLALADGEMTLYNDHWTQYQLGLSTLPAVESDIVDEMNMIYGLGYTESDDE